MDNTKINNKLTNIFKFIYKLKNLYQKINYYDDFIMKY